MGRAMTVSRCGAGFPVNQAGLIQKNFSSAGIARRKSPYLRHRHGLVRRMEASGRHRSARRRPGRCKVSYQVANDFLNPERALIFRITHRKNLSWMLENGLHCRHSPDFDPEFVNIGNADLIDKRNHHPVRHPMGDTLGDYVPFYFTPFSPMLLNIKTGRGVPQRPMEEIIILGTSLPHLQELDIPFVFTDRHAYLKTAQFSSDLDDLDWIDWDMLRRRDFKRDPEDPMKFERYQAEALIHRHLPIDALQGVFCYNAEVGERITRRVEKCGVDLKVVVRPKWYL